MLFWGVNLSYRDFQLDMIQCRSLLSESTLRIGDKFVAERTSYFCLARKLIWPLGWTHIFTQSGWLKIFYPDHFSGPHQIGESPLNTFFLRTFWKGQTYLLSTLFISSSSITTQWGKPSNLWTSWVCSHRPRVPSWIWIRWIQYATHRSHFKSPPTLAMSTATPNFAQTFSYFIPGQHFLETFRLLPPNNQDHTSMGDYIIPVLNQRTRPLLTVTLHVSLKHLAAKIPSQLHN